MSNMSSTCVKLVQVTTSAKTDFSAWEFAGPGPAGRELLNVVQVWPPQPDTS